MLVKELIAALQGQDPNAEVGIGFEHSHYVSKVGKILLEDRPSCVPAGMNVVVMMTSAGDYLPADEA